MTDVELMAGLEALKGMLIAVATGGPRIQEVNDAYQRQFALVAAELARRGLPMALCGTGTGVGAPAISQLTSLAGNLSATSLIL